MHFFITAKKIVILVFAPLKAAKRFFYGFFKICDKGIEIKRRRTLLPLTMY